jgi:membrane protease YdiL (CAAX protease family)
LRGGATPPAAARVAEFVSGFPVRDTREERALRTLRLVLLIVALLVVTAVVSPWVAWALEAAVGRPFTFSRVWNRVFEVLLVLGLALAWRRLDLGGPSAIGFRRAAWAHDLGRGLAAGVAGLGVGLGLCWAGGAVAPQLRFDPAKTAHKALLGAGAAVAVGVGEEALFRGVLLRRLSLDMGRAAGVAVTTGIYAAVHAIGKSEKVARPSIAAGFERLRALFAPLARRKALYMFLGLTAFGLLLAWARLRSGGLWLPIGIHAGWVAVFRVGRLFFDISPEPAWLVGPGWPPVVGGAAGFVAVVVTWLVLRRASRG